MCFLVRRYWDGNFFFLIKGRGGILKTQRRLFLGMGLEGSNEGQVGETQKGVREGAVD